ncbi:MAG TPA: hypothetical protein P5186_15030 [Candidatus Paceibacterota bacterium]|nr:hypothetical protein [Verrucomicrobiota bacterium]HRY49361.1 hypothetical protein [Candidatus Paceibacterota bacterium]HSA01077.1 hypothetical protein [Candidatus Paceibacterota bacterium]
MNPFLLKNLTLMLLAGCILAWVSCSKSTHPSSAIASDSPLSTNGTIEVTAKLVEIPDGAIFKRDLYDYATILKYEVLKVHRGSIVSNILYVGHYNPWKSRGAAADKRVKGIGGNLDQFRAGQTHRMALDVPIDDFFMGGIVNKYFGQNTGPLYWAVWTNLD